MNSEKATLLVKDFLNGRCKTLKKLGTDNTSVMAIKIGALTAVIELELMGNDTEMEKRLRRFVERDGASNEE